MTTLAPHRSHRPHRRQRHVHGRARRVSPRLRHWTYALAAVLWTSGALWWLLHTFYERTGDFGPQPHPLEPTLLRIHGLVAVPMLFALGWLGAAHVAPKWRAARRRWSGLALGALCVLLVISGESLYYLPDGAAHDVSGQWHALLGLIGIGIALPHWLRRRTPRASPGPDHAA